MATEAHGEAGKAVGMPQLDFSTWPNQIFWLLVTLVVIYFVLSKIALPRIGAVLADRKSTITNDLAAAGRVAGLTDKRWSLGGSRNARGNSREQHGPGTWIRPERRALRA